jgi:uncharacterized protein YeaO (DUF488 family)
VNQHAAEIGESLRDGSMPRHGAWPREHIDLFPCKKASASAEPERQAVGIAVRLKRVYEPPEPSDGYRVLIDRLWPRGVSKEQAHLDQWVRDLAPSSELRRWFGHDPAKFDEFRRRYRTELAAQEEKLRDLRSRARRGTLTLVYAARDTEHNDAVVLAELLRRRS